MNNVILVYVPNNDWIYRFVDYTSVTKVIDVAGRQAATKSIKSMDLTLEKSDKNCKNCSIVGKNKSKINCTFV